MLNHLLLIGYGYVASNLCYEAKKHFHKVTIFSRSKPLDNMDIKWIDINNISYFREGDFSHILITIPPHSEEQIIFFRIAHLLTQVKSIKWIGYVSSTSVYGNHYGNWVNEKSSLKTATTTGKNRIKSEQLWSKLSQYCSCSINILRLAGIYGPNRSTIDSFIKNTAKNIKKPGHYFSRIHIRDIVNIILELMDKETQNEIFNLADDLPAEQAEVAKFTSRMMNYPLPPATNIDDDNISPRLKEFYAENKKIDNSKIKKYLKYKMHYPSFKEGLKDIWSKNY